MNLKSIEICAGGGGQALGLELAGFEHVALVENDSACCETLRFNRPHWNVVEQNVQDFSARQFKDVDLFAGGVPCPPFSVAGKQLGQQDERDLFQEALRLIEECEPNAVMLENVRGLLDPKFSEYRNAIANKLGVLGYTCDWKLLNASQFGVSQLRPRVILIALRPEVSRHFSWPEPHGTPPKTVGSLLLEQMKSRGWTGADQWRLMANSIAPTIVGGSKKHGGPDLGPTRARKAWAELGVNGLSLANEAPDPSFVGLPRLTVDMVSRIQGFPPSWTFVGKKTKAYRQVGNAFPPPVATAIGVQIAKALLASKSSVCKVRPATMPHLAKANELRQV
ncbi:MAG: DNA cytosine methyltransferase [Proteobacteria bacterium]|nr:DNA cytosine methyltransferase [Pseudomonadota bacterium]